MNLISKSDLGEGIGSLGVPARRVTVLKIGVDTGRALIRFARAMPEYLYIGVEIKLEQATIANERANRSGVENVRVVCMDALDLMENFLPDSSIDEIFVFFPTPYEAALRQMGFSYGALVNEVFVDQAQRILRPYGSLRLVTDSWDYFSNASSLFAADDWWPVNWRRVRASVPDGFFVGTPCEARFRGAGVSIHAVQLLRLPFEGEAAIRTETQIL